MYYVIDYLTNPSVPDPDEGPFLEIHEEDIEVPGADAWQTGARFEEAIATPIRIEATQHNDHTGAPHDFFDGAISFMSPRLLKVLQDAGVDNFDLYPAIITYRKSKEKYEVFAFNLLGLVSAADVSASNLRSHDGDFKMDTSVRGFTVDPDKAKNLDLFRLAENCMTVVVHERIRDAIKAAGINTFAFVEPTDWFQL